MGATPGPNPPRGTASTPSPPPGAWTAGGPREAPPAQPVAGNRIDSLVLHGGVDVGQPEDGLRGQRRVVVGLEDDVLARVTGEVPDAQPLDLLSAAGREPPVVRLPAAQQPGVDGHLEPV